MGFFYRTIRIVENGIKPAYVFDGKPPELKSGVVRALPCPALYGTCLNVPSFSWRSGLINVKKHGKRERRPRRPVRIAAVHHPSSTEPLNRHGGGHGQALA
jgi:hypothetical protein